MFYITEIFLRLKYSCLSFFFIIFFCYIFNKKLLFIFIYPILQNYKFNDTFSYFIYTDPLEILYVYYSIFILLNFFFLIPYLFWHFLDFFKSSLYNYEYKILNFFFYCFLFFLIFINILIFFIILPNIWYFFEFFNKFTIIDQTIKIYNELKINDYFFFIFNFIYYINFSFILLLIFFFFIKKLQLKKLIYWRKFFFFLNLFFATFLSTPDIYSQLTLLFFFFIFFEILTFINILKFKKQLLKN